MRRLVLHALHALPVRYAPGTRHLAFVAVNGHRHHVVGGHVDFDERLASRLNPRGMAPRADAADHGAELSLIDVDEETVALARRHVVEETLRGGGVLRDEAAREAHSLVRVSLRRERLHPFADLRWTSVVRLSAEGELNVFKLPDEAVAAL